MLGSRCWLSAAKAGRSNGLGLQPVQASYPFPSVQPGSPHGGSSVCRKVPHPSAHSWAEAPAQCKSPRVEPASSGNAYRSSECGLVAGRSRERSKAPSISPTYQRNHASPLGEEDEGKEEEQIAFCLSF